MAAYVPDRVGATGMVGAFYLKANWPGRARQVANASFIMAPDWRNKGQPALFMTVRREIAQSPGESGARSREGGRHT
ncbi:MAG: hypothetical protein ABIO96_06960 [Nitrospiraceae bacterium]